ncbi:hypothetical protein T484DRAFT_2255674 [Baffinella frigidus]|nr:hypothetical protein T484DRAFT_2255674 [Cryptophyta sp. CCMP2293]
MSRGGPVLAFVPRRAHPEAGPSRGGPVLDCVPRWARPGEDPNGKRRGGCAASSSQPRACEDPREDPPRDRVYHGPASEHDEPASGQSPGQARLGTVSITGPSRGS